MLIPQMLLYILQPQKLAAFTAEEAGAASQAGGQQNCPGGRAVQQGGDAVGREEVGAEEGEAGGAGTRGAG